MDIGGMSMSARDEFKLQPLGDCGLLITLGDVMNEMTLAKVSAVTERLEAQSTWAGFVECVPAYASVALYYNPYLVSLNRRPDEARDETVYQTVSNRVRAVLIGMPFGSADGRALRTVRIPVCYGGDYGPDLGEVAAHAGLTTEEVVALHSGGKYTVYMIGFAPGFPYLGGMPETIAAPRRTAPRTIIPAGSVGIAGGQTGVYPIGTPGGWQIIGRTPMPLFRPRHSRPSLLEGGDRVEFVPITREQFEDWPTGAEENEDHDGGGAR
ncbi:5-oxoprolinase subunit PxpB [Paenibacillus sp. LHD-117]|uniref:5-oxoprolinase subunit PxpB n=1 Tax=Paenibacillus sp. LHD-117 TaxID=3071412 RepID=UPI0027DFF407|nr:5-oxoprolinase subunit PxpB [Paenibacillus sp. LHD-117]MDQ6422557.1 5-oxoprolinase subunit PxpB [Paenibacillus sp. LHD-117]